MHQGIGWLIIGGGILLAGCTQQAQSANTTIDAPKVALVAPQKDTDFAAARQALTQFLTRQMVQPDGIYTNFLDSQGTGDTATGHEYLSESTGLWLQHLVLTKQPAAFKTFYQRSKTTLWQGQQFTYRYDPARNYRYPVNAGVDDLHIVNAVGRITRQTKQSAWQHTYTKLARTVLANTVPQGRVVDYVDAQTHERAQQTTLCYVDLATLQPLLPTRQYAQALALVQTGRLTGHLPLYATRYDFQKHAYTGTDSINIVESLLTAVHLAEVEKVPAATVNWVKYQVQNDTLYNRWGADGTPQTTDRSAAGYALAAQLGLFTGDRALAKLALQRALAFQITAAGAPLTGALGDLPSQQVYSFDNLTTLVTLDMYLNGES